MVFVIDSSDDLRIAVAKNELEIIMENESKSWLNPFNLTRFIAVIQRKKPPILFFANK